MGYIRVDNTIIFTAAGHLWYLSIDVFNKLDYCGILNLLTEIENCF